MTGQPTEITRAIEKEKKYEHIAVRPATFARFRRAKGDESDDKLLIRLLNHFEGVNG